jgi:hypothetical protein
MKSAVPLANTLRQALLTGPEQATGGSIQWQDRDVISRAITLRRRSMQRRARPPKAMIGNFEVDWDLGKWCRLRDSNT